MSGGVVKWENRWVLRHSSASRRFRTPLGEALSCQVEQLRYLIHDTTAPYSSQPFLHELLENYPLRGRTDIRVLVKLTRY